MAIFYRHDVIYQAQTTGWWEIALEEPGWDQTPPPPVVLRPDVFLSRTEEVLDEIAVIESGWDQTFNPPLVPLRVVAPSSISFVDDVVVVVVEEPGWDQAFNPPIVPSRKVPPSVYVIGLQEDSEDFPIVDDVPMVLRPDVFYSSVVIVHEVPVIESGWDQAFNPPLVPARVIPPSSTVIVLDVAPIDSGWVQIYNPPLVPPRKIPPSSLAFVDDVPPIDTGWVQTFNPPLVLARVIPPSSVSVVDDVVVVDDMGWLPSDPVLLFLARFVPASSSTMSGLEEAVAPAVVVVRMRLLGGGLLKRKQLG